MVYALAPIPHPSSPDDLERYAALSAFADWLYTTAVATVAGWYVTEIGRQPFVVSGLVRTADVATTVPSTPMIGLTLTLYLVLYAALIVVYVSVLKYMAEKPEQLLQLDALEQSATPAGAITSPVLPSGGAA